MGLFDRLKKEPGPDALTLEAVARARAVTGVASAEAVDADTVSVTWVDVPGSSTLSLVEVRSEWSKASGFRRIELMDDLIASLSTPEASWSTPPAAPVDDTSPPPEPEAPPAPTGPAWSDVRDRLRVRIGRSGTHHGAIVWPVAGVLQAAVVTDEGAPVTHEDVRAWDVDADTVRAATLRLLAAEDPGLDPIDPSQPAWVPTRPADHPPTWLAAPDRLLAACGLAEAVVLAPTPTELVVVDPGSHDLLRSILTSTKSILATEEHVLWPAPFLASAGGIAPWAPDADHPCHDLVAELAALADG